VNWESGKLKLLAKRGEHLTEAVGCDVRHPLVR
jgi:hypothetical protein